MTMKTHTRKKMYRVWLKDCAKAGKMNNPAGQMVNRASLPENSMRRDYSPQVQGK